MTGSTLTITTEERSSRISVGNSLSTSAQSSAPVKRASRMLGIIKKATTNKTENFTINTFIPLYKSMVDPTQFWFPMFKGCSRTRKGTEKSNKDDQGMERLLHY